MSSQDILAAIDDAVSSRCACGCGVKLDPDGPSQWYATPECQWKFQQQHAHDPGDVYARPDAVDVWVGADGLQVPLREHRGRAERSDHVHITLDNREGRLRPNPDRVRGLTPNRMWLDGVEITDHVSAIDLNPMLSEVTAYGDTNWRETLSGLRSFSMSLSNVEWSAAVVEDLSSRRTEDDWAAVNPTAAGNIWGVPVYTSPYVPEGQIVLVNQDAMRIMGEQLTESFQLAGDSIRRFIDALARLGKSARRADEASVQLKRARMRYLHSAYSFRQLSRRRRNR